MQYLFTCSILYLFIKYKCKYSISYFYWLSYLFDSDSAMKILNSKNIIEGDLEILLEMTKYLFALEVCMRIATTFYEV